MYSTVHVVLCSMCAHTLILLFIPIGVLPNEDAQIFAMHYGAAEENAYCPLPYT